MDYKKSGKYEARKKLLSSSKRARKKQTYEMTDKEFRVFLLMKVKEL
jgi:hypothetical protein